MVPPGDRIATISTVPCTSNIPAATAAPWSLLLSDGVTASPIRSGTASDTEPPPSRDGSANIGSHDNCRSGSIAFDIRAADKADPVEIGYNSGSTSLSWHMTPPPQS